MHSCRCNTTVRSIPSDPRTQTTVPACQTDRNVYSITRKTPYFEVFMSKFRAVPSYDRPFQASAPRREHLVGRPWGERCRSRSWALHTPTTHLALTNGSYLAMFSHCDSGQKVAQRSSRRRAPRPCTPPRPWPARGQNDQFLNIAPKLTH